MMKTTEEMMQMQSDAVKAVGVAAQKALEGFQKLSALNLQTAKASLETATEHAKSLLAVRDLKSASEVVTTMVQPATEKVTAYAKSAYGVSSATSAELVDVVRAQAEKGSHQLLMQVQELAKNTPAGSDGAVTFVKQVLAVANSSYEQLNAATKTLVEATLAGASASVAAAAAPAQASGKQAKA